VGIVEVLDDDAQAAQARGHGRVDARAPLVEEQRRQRRADGGGVRPEELVGQADRPSLGGKLLVLGQFSVKSDAMKKLTAAFAFAFSISLALGAAAAHAEDGTSAVKAAHQEVTLKGTLGCGKCSFHEASACENVLKVQTGDKIETYLLADNDVSRANHEKVCGPASPATVTGTVSEPKAKDNRAKKPRRKLLTASSIKFD
jgi:hypothetical protein